MFSRTDVRDDRPSSCTGPADSLAAGVPYAYASVTRGLTTVVFTAGACPLDTSGATIAAGDVEAQAETVMTNLRSALQAAGARLDDVVKTTVYVASGDRADLAAAWRVVHAHFRGARTPSTLLGVSVLGYPRTSWSKWRPSRRWPNSPGNVGRV